MVRQYYVDEITGLSEQELETVFQAAEPPVCLIGGWAVHTHVSDGFESEYGRGYIGSRDIDIGVHIDPDWSADEIEASPAADTIRAIESLDFERSRFGFVKHFDRQQGTQISTDEVQELPQHRTFDVFVDIIPDTNRLSGFESAFGFRPPSEPLLRHAFDGERVRSLAAVSDWDVPDAVSIAEPVLLAAMKIRSIPNRDKDQKRVKDIADLHALLWYVEEYSTIREQIVSIVNESDLEELDACTDERTFADSAGLLQIDRDLIAESIQRLRR